MRWRSLCVVVVVDGLSRAALGQASFNGLGQFPGFSQGTYVGGVSNDGQVIVGWAETYIDSFGYSAGLVWRDGACSQLPEPLPNQSYRAHAASSDGLAIAGHTGWPSTYEQSACAWLGSSTYANGPGGTTLHIDITFDGGLVMISGEWCRCTRLWNPVTGVATEYTAAPFVGSRFARSSRRIAGRMRSDWGDLLSLLEPDSHVLTVFPWKALAGYAIAANEGPAIIANGLWTYSVTDTAIADEFQFAISDVSADGSIIVGNADYEPFLWSAAGGSIALRCALGRFGITTTGWQFSGDRNIRCSGDGLTIVGNGTNPQGKPEGWVARLPFIPHAADFDGSGFVDTDDYDAFVAAFDAGDFNTDFDASGFVDTDDFDAFVHAFEAGC